jgi:hypothetical protein
MVNYNIYLLCKQRFMYMCDVKMHIFQLYKVYITLQVLLLGMAKNDKQTNLLLNKDKVTCMNEYIYNE